MKRRKIALISLPVHPSILPLASGTIECYSKADPDVRATYDFCKFSYNPAASDDEILAELISTDASVYGFSCYVWNMGRVRRLLKKLLEAKPKADFLLGGPQVINQAERYLALDQENVYICNGEGEKTLRSFLLQSTESTTDYGKVKGLALVRDGTILTTEPFDRIKDLNEIPSPFLEGVFEKGRYAWFLLETNRGCPFKCTYCFWGGAIGAKVNKYGEDRILEELAWIARYPALTLHIVDANVGMLDRDLRYAEHLCEIHQEIGYPKEVIFSASKNTPARVSKFASILADGGLLATQPISLQTLSKRTLEHVKRDNIKPEVYLETQRILNEKGISSYVELIWPLPGETLDSFQAGISELCSSGADSFTIYPLILINNVEMNTKREEYGLVAFPDPDPDSEAEIVITTKDVDPDSYREGLKFAMTVTSLYSGRGLWCLGRYLDNKKICSYTDLMQGFVEYLTRYPENAFSKYMNYVLDGNQHKYSSFGGTLHCSHFADRQDFDRLLGRYLDSRDWFDDKARLRFELDLINRPYVYVSQAQKPAYDFRFLQIDNLDKYSFQVTVPASCLSIIRDHFQTVGPVDSTQWNVEYKNKQWPYMRQRDETSNFMYCHEKLEKIGTILAKWSAA